MRNDGQPQNQFDAELYLKSQGQLRRLKSNLPRESVESVAREVIRRLAEHQTLSATEAPSSEEIERLCHALISDEDEAGARFILEARTAGASVEAIYLKYLASAARMLGDWWQRDEASFVQVTIGTTRMYAIMRTLSYQLPISSIELEKYAVFASVPGETHTLGVRMAADLFRKEGWDIDLRVGETHEDLVSEIKRSQTNIIGLSAAGQHSLKPLSRLVVAIRITRPTVALFVSGQILDEHKETVGLLDIDGLANDFEAAKQLLESFGKKRPKLRDDRS